MKKSILFILFMFVGMITVNAGNYSPTAMRDVINGGDVTTDFEKQLKNDGCEYTINSTANDTSLTIVYKFKCIQEKEEITHGEKKNVKRVTYDSGNTINFTLKDGVLSSVVEMSAEQVEKDPYYEKVMQLVPYWGAEMSSRYPQIKKYIKDNHDKKYIETFSAIFDVCYYEQMGVCYSKTPGMYKTTFTGKVKMDDSAADYALKYLKKEQREINNKGMMVKALVLAGILVIIILICKSMAPNKTKRPLKY